VVVYPGHRHPRPVVVAPARVVYADDYGYREYHHYHYDRRDRRDRWEERRRIRHERWLDRQERRHDRHHDHRRGGRYDD
jgi:hypothetical protein